MRQNHDAPFRIRKSDFFRTDGRTDGQTEATTGSGYFGRISVRVWPALDVALQICLLESAGALGEYAGSYPHLFTSGLWK